MKTQTFEDSIRFDAETPEEMLKLLRFSSHFEPHFSGIGNRKVGWQFLVIKFDDLLAIGDVVPYNSLPASMKPIANWVLDEINRIRARIETVKHPKNAERLGRDVGALHVAWEILNDHDSCHVAPPYVPYPDLES